MFSLLHTIITINAELTFEHFFAVNKICNVEKYTLTLSFISFSKLLTEVDADQHAKFLLKNMLKVSPVYILISGFKYYTRTSFSQDNSKRILESLPKM